MLRIRNGIDLHILERYGFVYNRKTESWEFFEDGTNNDGIFNYTCAIDKDGRISGWVDHVYNCNDDDESGYYPYLIIDCLIDLLRNGIIEKI